MTYAVFSDIHASQTGLAKLLAHNAFQNADKRICLGDTINAHQPDTAISFFKKVTAACDMIVMGNHEAVLAGKCDTTVFDAKVRPDISESILRLQNEAPQFLQRLAGLPMACSLGQASGVHASFNPQRPWQHIRYTEDVQAEAAYLPRRINVLAHGHIPFIAWLENDFWYYQRQIYDEPFTLETTRTYLINSGGVLGSREMRNFERTFLVYDDEAAKVTFYNLEG